MEAGKRTIRDVFNRGRNLEIPFFQRAYVWGEEQWQRFLKQQETASNIDSKLTIIDGQQRLTTLNIFMKVFCLKNNLDDDYTETFKKQRDKSIILLHNHNDVKSFNNIVNLTELEDKVESDNKIFAAYNFFKENISNDKINRKLDFFNILDNILFVGIDLYHVEDEQQIFDTINSLGVRLTTAELLKNYFFKRDELNEYNKYWKNIFEENEEVKYYWDNEVTTGRTRRTFIDLFFYSYLQIKIQEKGIKIKAEDKIEFSKVETLFDSYKLLIKKYELNKINILKEIKEYALLFKDNFDVEIINKEISEEFGIERINAIIFGLETSTLIPYILYILKNNHDEENRNELFEYIESYIMRRMIVHATTKNYNQLFTDQLISNKITSKDLFLEYIMKAGDKVNYFPNNDDIKTGFQKSKLINKQAAGILYLLESKIRDRSRHTTQLLGINKYSLEHLLPKKWENNWENIEDKALKDLRNRTLLTLGNLAIITQSLNSSIRDSSWEIKKHGNGKRNGLKHYSAGIETLAPYLEYDNWNETHINERASFLYEKSIEIWKYEEQNNS